MPPPELPAGPAFAGVAAANVGAVTTLRQPADAQGRGVGFALTSSYRNEAQYKSITDNKFKFVIARPP